MTSTQSPPGAATPLASGPMKRPFTREQRTTIVYGILSIVFLIDVLQLWLLIASMNAYLGGDTSVLWPAAAASVVCLLLNVGLLRYVYANERR